MRKALAAAEGCDFKRVVSTRGTLLPGSLAGISFLFALILAMIYPHATALALVRLADPFGDHRWPAVTQVALTVSPSATRVSSNAEVKVTAHVTGVVPDKATLVVRRGPENPAEDRLEKQPDDIEKELTVRDGVATKSLKANDLPGHCHLFVRANDGASTAVEIVVVQPPTLEMVDGRSSLQVRLDYPAYTRQPSPYLLPPGIGNVGNANIVADEPLTVPGTVVSVRARANKDIQRAWVEFVPKPEGLTWSRVLACSGTGPAVYPVTLESDHRTFSVHFTARLSGAWTIRLEDDLGSSKYPLGEGAGYQLSVREDPAPTVKLVSPRTGTKAEAVPVLVGDEMPLGVVAEDRIFGIRSVFLRYRFAADTPWLKVETPLFDHATARRDLIAPWAGGSAFLAAEPLPDLLEFHNTLRLARLKHPDGSPPRPGDVITVQVGADDFDDVNWTKGPGYSDAIDLRVVDRPTLRTTLDQEQEDIRKALLEVQKKEHEINERIRTLQKKVEEDAKTRQVLERLGFSPEEARQVAPGLNEKERDELGMLVHKQLELERAVGGPKEGLRDRIARLRERLAQDGRQDGAEDQRLARLERELKRLAENELKVATTEIDKARQEANLDDQDLADRKAQRTRKAAQLENEAKSAEKLAGLHEQTAASMEEAARGETEPAKKARLEKEARDQRQGAEKQAARARALQESARLERERPDSDLAAHLATSRARQEEIEKTIDDLLGGAASGSGIEEAQRDAVRLLQQQRQLERDVQTAQARLQAGRKPEDLTEPEREHLRGLAEQQRRLGEQADALLEQMTKAADKADKENPEAGRSLRQSRDEARKGVMPGRMKEAADQVGRNQLNQGAETQQQVNRQLEKLVQELDRRRDEDLERLARRTRENEKRLERLVKENEELQRKVREAAAIPDADKREQELKRLAREQERVRKDAEDMLKVLDRQRANRPLAQAVDALGQEGKDLQEGKVPQPGQQQEGLDRLQEARAEVKKAGDKIEEELTREQLVRVADSLRRLKERQAALVAEGVRLQTGVKEAGEWRLEVKKEWLRLADVQGRKKDGAEADGVPGLGDETNVLANRDLAGAPVLARLLIRSADAMEQSSERLRSLVRTQPAPASLPDAELTRLQAEALRRLEQVLAAVQDEVDRPRRANNARPAGDKPPPPPQGSSRPNAGDGIPPLAQLKLLRNLQREVNQASEDFRKQHPDLTKLTEAERSELRSINRLQKVVAELFEELRRQPGEAAAVGEMK